MGDLLENGLQRARNFYIGRTSGGKTTAILVLVFERYTQEDFVN